MIDLLKKLVERAEIDKQIYGPIVLELDPRGLVIRTNGGGRGISWAELEHARPEIYDDMVDYAFSFISQVIYPPKEKRLS
jgi:hypothetical protein